MEKNFAVVSLQISEKPVKRLEKIWGLNQFFQVKNEEEKDSPEFPNMALLRGFSSFTLDSTETEDFRKMPLLLKLLLTASFPKGNVEGNVGKKWIW